jgi:hypothetical protein
MSVVAIICMVRVVSMFAAGAAAITFLIVIIIENITVIERPIAVVRSVIVVKYETSIITNGRPQALAGCIRNASADRCIALGNWKLPCQNRWGARPRFAEGQGDLEY